jgi:anti-sigma-K factor RskA
MSDPRDERIAAALRDLEPDDLAPPSPPDDLWADIAAEVATDATGEGRGPVADVSAAAPLDEVAPSGTGRPRRWRWISVAAAAVVVLVVGAVVITSQESPNVVARADLTADDLPLSTGATGSAILVEDGDGWVLDVDLADLPPIDDGRVFEVWLLDPDEGGVQTLGLTEGVSKLVVPPSIDPTRYPVVDVSREPTDGNPTHSGDSILRGRLDQV